MRTEKEGRECLKKISFFQYSERGAQKNHETDGLEGLPRHMSGGIYGADRIITPIEHKTDKTNPLRFKQIFLCDASLKLIARILHIQPVIKDRFFYIYVSCIFTFLHKI